MQFLRTRSESMSTAGAHASPQPPRRAGVPEILLDRDAASAQGPPAKAS